MKKTYLYSLCARCLTLLVLALLSTNLAWGAKITTLAGITSGNKYYIGATTGGSDYYFYVDGSSKTESIKGAAKGDVADAVALTFTAVTDGWTIQFDNGLYLGLKNAKDNGAVQVMESPVVWTIEEDADKGLLKLHPNDYYLQKNNSGTQFGSYKATQTNVWLESASSSKTLSSIAISGTPTKTEYYVGDAFDPAGLTVTGTYDDKSTAEITSGITWEITPSGALTVGTTSVSVKATVGEITSDAYMVNGLTVTEFVQTYANTYTTGNNITGVSGNKVIIDKVEYDAIKAGTGKVAGSCVVIIPENTKTLHFHAAGWKGESVTLTVTTENDETGTNYDLVADENIQGTATSFTLKNDPEENDYFTLDPQGETSITLTATSGNRFVIFGVNAELFKTENVTITDAGWATACLPFNATVSDNATAYYVTTSGSTLNKVKANVIPAGEGVLLERNEGGAATVTFTETAVAVDDVKANYMLGSVEDKVFDESGFKYYILANDKNLGLGFYFQVAEGVSANCAAGKAVLAVPTEVAGAKTGFPFDDEPTGIKDVQSSGLKVQGSVYNLNGVRVNENYNGIVIMNGKKYINK